MSLFGEESYEDQEPPSMQLGPVWAPSWLPPASPASPAAAQPTSEPPLNSHQSHDLQNPHPEEALQANIDLHQHHQQQWQWQQHNAGAFSNFPHIIGAESTQPPSVPPVAPFNSALPVAAAAPSDGHLWAGMDQSTPVVSNEAADTASDFGSFTDGSLTDFQPNSSSVPPPQVGYTTAEAPVDSVMSSTGQNLDAMHAFNPSQAPDPDWGHSRQTVTGKAVSVPSDSPHAYRHSSSGLRPAAAAARESVLQSMNRSVPISLDALGAEEVQDAELVLPSQPGVAKLPSFPGTLAFPTSSSLQSADFNLRSADLSVQQLAVAITEQQSSPDWVESSWQGVDLAFPSEFQAAVPGFSATWPSATVGHEQLAAEQRFAASGPVVFEAFAAAPPGMA